jgi:hypothetical protein
MKAWRVYLLVVGIPVLGILVILRSAPARPLVAVPPAASTAAVSATAHMPNIPTLLLQIGVILLATRIVGRLFRRIGQPQVVGEMAAGILLGPSLLGWLAPGASAVLFPVEDWGRSCFNVLF